MTFDELYEYGMKSSPAKVCIPQELVQSLPRLERINGRIVVQYWYYYRNVSYPWQIDDPLYYAAFDIYEDKLVEMKALSHHTFGQSWLDLLFWSREMREVKYLEHCVTLLERGNITEEEIAAELRRSQQGKDCTGNERNRSGCICICFNGKRAEEY